MKTFKSNPSLVYNELLVFVVFIILIILFDSKYDIYLISGLLFFALIYAYMNSKVIEISISEKEVLIVKWQFRKLRAIYNRTDISISYNFEMAGRAVKQRVLRIYSNNELIAKLKPSFSGWDNETIEKIVATLS